MTARPPLPPAGAMAALGICTVSPGGTILSCNAAICNMLGHGRQELDGTLFAELLDTADGDWARQRFATLAAGGSAEFDCQLTLRSKSGRPVLASCAASPLPGGGFSLALSRLRADRHERLSLNDATSTVGSLVTLLGAGIVYTNLDLVVEFCTPAFAALLGAEAEDLVGKNLASLGRAGDLRLTPAELRALLSGETRRHDADVHYLRADGSEAASITTLALGRDDRGRPAYFTAVVRSIGQRQEELELAVRQRTLELEAERRRFRMLFDESPDAHLVISAKDVVIVDCNHSAERMLRLPRAEIIGRSPVAFETPVQPDGTPTPDVIRHVLAEADRHGTAKADMLRRRLDGTEFWVSASVARSSFDGIGVNLWVWRDIDERKKLESDLDAARRKAEEANLAKSAFLAAMSHEIRTPLNAVISTSHLLQQGRSFPEQKRDLEVIESAASSLLMVVNDVLDISKIEAGEFVPDSHPFSLAEILRDMVKLFEVPARRKNLALAVSADLARLPKLLLGDGDSLRHILTNLVSNAVKFTSEGRISLDVRDIGREAVSGRHLLRFAVSDTGIGIAEDKLGRLFKPFSQADSSTTRRYGGTGLGLFIVRRLVELMGGRYGVDSRAGEGASFWFEIGLHPVATGAAPRQGGPSGDGLEIGYWSSSSAERERFAALCAPFGWTLRIITLPSELAGLDALVLGSGAPSAPAGGLPTLRQPDLSSAEAAAALFDSLDALFREAGRGPDFLAGRTTIKAGGLRWLAGATVLAVDDSQTNLEILARILESSGARTLTCTSGAEAVEVAAAHAETIDLVLMDMQMPDLDGCDATLLLRQRPGTADIPILALTAGATLQEKERALASGMNDFLTKPLNAAALIRTVRRYAEQRRGQPLRLTGGETPRVPA